MQKVVELDAVMCWWCPVRVVLDRQAWEKRTLRVRSRRSRWRQLSDATSQIPCFLLVQCNAHDVGQLGCDVDELVDAHGCASESFVVGDCGEVGAAEVHVGAARIFHHEGGDSCAGDGDVGEGCTHHVEFADCDVAECHVGQGGITEVEVVDFSAVDGDAAQRGCCRVEPADAAVGDGDVMES